MPVSFACPETGKKLRIADQLIGKSFRCPACGKPHVVPAQETAAITVAAVPAPPAQPSRSPAPTAAQAAPLRGPGSLALRATRRNARLRKPKTFWQKYLPVLALSAVACLAIASVVIVRYLQNDKERTRIFAMLTFADNVYDRGEIEEAAQLAISARRAFQRKRAIFDAERASRFDQLAHFFAMRCQQKQDAEEIQWGAWKDFADARQRLSAMIAAIEKSGDRTGPIVAHINKALDNVRRAEMTQVRKELEREVNKARSAYLEGKIQEAKTAAEQLLARINSLPEPMTREIGPRIKVLAERVRKAEEILEKSRLLQEDAKQGKDLPAIIKELETLAAGTSVREDTWVYRQLHNAMAQLRAQQKMAQEAQQALAGDGGELAEFAQILVKTSNNLSLLPNSINNSDLSFKIKCGEDIQTIYLHSQGLIIRSGNYHYNIPLRSLGVPELGLRICGALAVAMQRAQIPPNARHQPWVPSLQASLPPAPMAVRQDSGKETTSLFIQDRIYEVRPAALSLNQLEPAASFANAAKTLADAFDKSGESAEEKEICQTLAAVIHATYQPPQPNDFLPQSFCRQIVAQGYLQKQAPAVAGQLQPLIDNYIQKYRAITAKVALWQSSEVEGAVTLDNRHLWRFYDRSKDTTTFAELTASRADSGLFVYTTFAGALSAWPQDKPPVRVSMVHCFVGEVASYDVKSGKFTADVKSWNAGCQIMQVPFESMPEHFGPPGWDIPPHVLIVDAEGSPRAIVTPNGRLDLPDFPAIQDENDEEGKKARQKAQDRFVEQCAQVLISPGELHLFYKYFMAYCLDSPLPGRPDLIGSGKHTGDIHQNHYQFLDRKIGDRFVGDCDDLAEFYQRITRKQGKLSYVLGVPAHATCGFVDKKNGTYVMTFVDTGPPRQFKGDKLASVVEAGLRSYDPEGTESFDANGVEFLLRFAGERTRTGYYLSIRMFEDAQYAKTMIQVQSHWHFNTYLLGIKTMEEMQKTDKTPANCFELAGLYGRVREIDKALKWLQVGIDALAGDDVMARAKEQFRYAKLCASRRDQAKALAMLDETARLLDVATAATGPEQRLRFLGLRFDAAQGFYALKEPWKGWAVVEQDAGTLFKAEKVAHFHGAILVELYRQMKTQERAGKTLSSAEQKAVQQLGQYLRHYVKTKLFERDDSFVTTLYKYNIVADFYAGEYGDNRLLEELLKKGPYPLSDRDHVERGDNPEPEDWKWIRLCLYAYNSFINESLQDEQPGAKPNPDKAVEIIDAALTAVEQARRFGSLARFDDQLKGLRIWRAVLKKEWKALEGVLQEVQQKKWNRLDNLVTETLGSASMFITADEFRDRVMPLFASNIAARQHYFALVYNIYNARQYEAARVAAQAAVKKFPNFKEMAEEARHLDDLISARKKEERERK